MLSLKDSVPVSVAYFQTPVTVPGTAITSAMSLQLAKVPGIKMDLVSEGLYLSIEPTKYNPASYTMFIPMANIIMANLIQPAKENAKVETIHKPTK